MLRRIFLTTGCLSILSGLFGGRIAGAVHLGLNRFPSVRELEAGMQAFPGSQIPKQVISHGRAWNAYYMGAKELGNGMYLVTVRLV